MLVGFRTGVEDCSIVEMPSSVPTTCQAASCPIKASCHGDIPGLLKCIGMRMVVMSIHAREVASPQRVAASFLPYPSSSSSHLIIPHQSPLTPDGCMDDGVSCSTHPAPPLGRAQIFLLESPVSPTQHSTLLLAVHSSPWFSRLWTPTEPMQMHRRAPPGRASRPPPPLLHGPPRHSAHRKCKGPSAATPSCSVTALTLSAASSPTALGTSIKGQAFFPMRGVRRRLVV